MKSLIIPESGDNGYRLGRHVAHDPRSLDFPADVAKAVRSVDHTVHGSTMPLDQGDLGSCTGNAMAGLLMTEPFFIPGRILGESDAVSLYERATVLDDKVIPGEYPPDDTGSAGLYVAKAAKERGWCRSYRHAFGLDHALGALTLRPVIIGINWYDSFDRPDSNGVIRISPNAGVRGGHELVMVRNDATNKMSGGVQSWGRAWGEHGRFWIPWGDFDRLLHEDGDVLTVIP